MTITIANNNINSSGTLTVNNRALSNVAFTGDYDDLTNKPNIGSGGLLVDSWNDDDGNWYRKYDDGFIEQGGVTSGGKLPTITTITLHRSFSSVNYTIAFCPYGAPVTGGYNNGLQEGSKTTSRFSIVGHDAANKTINNFSWYAAGY